MRMERFRRFLKHENRQSNISLPQIQPFSNSPSLLLNYFKIVLNFGYGLFLIPFRLKLVGTKHKLHVNRIQQCICIIVHISIMFEYISMIRKIESWSDVFKSSHEDPFNSLYVVGTFASIIYGLSFSYSFWFKREVLFHAFTLIENIQFTQLTNNNSGRTEGDTRQTSRYSSRNNWKSESWIEFKIKALGVLLCAMYTIFGLTDSSTSVQHNPLLIGNFSVYFSQLYSETKYFYLFNNEEKDKSTDFDTFTTMLTIFRLLIRVPRFLLIQLLECIVFATTLCMRHLIMDFLQLRKANLGNNSGRICRGRSRISESSSTSAATSALHQQQQELLGTSSSSNIESANWPCNSVDEILLQYDKLKEIVKALNSGVKILTFVCIGVSLPLYASWSAIVFFEENVKWRHHLHFCFYFGTFFTLLTLAAEFHAKSGDFYRWIAANENVESISPNKLTSILIDMQSNEIALKGSGGIFIVTYRFFGTILSVIVTYTIIILQFQASKRGGKYGNNGHEYLLQPILLSSRFGNYSGDNIQLHSTATTADCIPCPINLIELFSYFSKINSTMVS